VIEDEDELFSFIKMVNFAWTVTSITMNDSNIGVSKPEEVTEVHDEGSQKVSLAYRREEKKRFLH
jgi:hypothetical protein